MAVSLVVLLWVMGLVFFFAGVAALPNPARGLFYAGAAFEIGAWLVMKITDRE